ncbi:MAG: hypothetical protein EB084_21355, partial [Proteobacteria bacterium]|nr:hypothetical protein [Pseudomonadota bacterium]
MNCTEQQRERADMTYISPHRKSTIPHHDVKPALPHASRAVDRLAPSRQASSNTAAQASESRRETTSLSDEGGHALAPQEHALVGNMRTAMAESFANAQSSSDPSSSADAQKRDDAAPVEPSESAAAASMPQGGQSGTAASAGVGRATADAPQSQAQEIGTAVGRLRHNPQYNLESSKRGELKQRLGDYARNLEPERGQRFVENAKKGVLGLEQPLGQFTEDVHGAYKSAGIPNSEGRVALDSSAVRGAPSKAEKGDTFRPDGDMKASDAKGRPSDLDTAFRATDQEFRDLATRRMQELQTSSGQKGSKAAVPQEYPLRMSETQPHQGAEIRTGTNGERFLKMKSIEDLATANRDSRAFVKANPGEQQTLSSPARQLAETYERGLLRGNDLPSASFDGKTRPSEGVRANELAEISARAGREVGISAVRQGGQFDPAQKGEISTLERPRGSNTRAAERPAVVMEGVNRGLGAMAAAGGVNQIGAGVEKLKKGEAVDGSVDLAAGALNTVGGTGMAAGGNLAQVGGRLVGAGLVVDGGRDLVNGVANGNVEQTAVGGVKTVGGGALIAGGTAAATVAPVALGGLAVYEGGTQMMRGIRSGDNEQVAVGGAKAVAG